MCHSDYSKFFSESYCPSGQSLLMNGPANANTICNMEVQSWLNIRIGLRLPTTTQCGFSLAKLVKGGGKQGRRDKLLRALDDAARHYKDSNQKVRQAFFHGLLTGYAVALTLR